MYTLLLSKLMSYKQISNMLIIKYNNNDNKNI
jgi:hypothetical protein